jgi:hypothetical protein
MMSKTGRRSFLKKRTKKLLFPAASPAAERTQHSKSLLLLFFRKEGLTFVYASVFSSRGRTIA